MKVTEKVRVFGLSVLLALLVYTTLYIRISLLSPVREVRHYTQTDKHCVAPGMESSVALWEQEVERRFQGAYIYAAHGGVAAHSWICQGPNDPSDIAEAEFVRDVALRLRAQFPDRVIVLIVCNPGHFKLHVPGVYYARDSVWLTPDKYAGYCDLAHLLTPEAVGNIFEFSDE